ncbi:FkbM family methyltransferase [Pedobacter fastidiosus]|uniref:FkbM family methyltransferase n=1 Tax=Pedobacter fastidiosus TaxID=2765361 RepID=A0ABR7KVV5_9SPHI|nr:FkbM family methyltransferase [Pedobacter fastidiosus]MBC6112176.1 FkbM family methyltransferase [Pedobacter fastidiosus]
MIKKLFKKILQSIGIQISLTDNTDPNQITEKKIGNYIMKLNHSHIHNSKFIFENYDKNLSRLVKSVKQKFADSSVIDVGANIGDSVAIIKQLSDVPIICIEGDDKYFKLLNANIKQFDNVVAINSFLGEKAEIIDGELKYDSGTLKIDLSASNNKITINTLDDLFIQNEHLFKNCKFLKIDTDGFDFKILKGAVNLIRRQNPVLFFEYSEQHLREAGDDGLLLFEMIKELGYKYLAYYDHTGRFMLSTNSDNVSLSNQMHNYISNYNSVIPYFDIAAFQATDQDIFEQTIEEETKINRSGPNKLLYNP